MSKVYTPVILLGLILSIASPALHAASDKFNQNTFHSLKTKLWIDGLSREHEPVGTFSLPKPPKIGDKVPEVVLPEELVVGIRKASEGMSGATR